MVDGSSVDKVKNLADETDRAFLSVVRALGRATRWTGARIGRVPAVVADLGGIRAPSGLRQRLAKLLQTEARRAKLEVDSATLERLADRLVAVVGCVLSGAADVEDIQVLKRVPELPERARPKPP